MPHSLLSTRCDKVGAMVGLLLVCTVALGGCGGIKFTRASGAFKYRALPVGTPIQSVERAALLPKPTAHIGTLVWAVETRTDPKPNTALAETKFGKFAARYGCDAVVGLIAKTIAKKATKKVKKMGSDGKYVYNKVETTTYTHTYTAHCVRTAKAPGGLADGASSVPPPTPPQPEATKADGSAAESKTKSDKSDDKFKPKAESDPDVLAVWKALKPYSGTMLKNWKKALAAPPASAHDVLGAFSELMVQVSGPTGIWRRTVPHEWFGCKAQPKQEQCTKVAKASAEFAPWDRFQRAMERQSPKGARGWLKRNRRRLLAYIERYVPRAPNLTGIQQTPLYIEKVR
ncbi:MAG: hypothetical protein KC502_11170 [Myxococcales bacterium]|nr:hypothetical protein [Myxococcales bacterium]